MNEGEVILSQDQVQVLRIMMDECSDYDPDKLRRLFLILEYIMAMWR